MADEQQDPGTGRDSGRDSEFDRAVAARPRPGRPGAYDVELDAGWSVGGGINGGIQLALMGAVLADVCGGHGHRDTLAASAVYLAPGVPGPGEVTTEVIRAGRATSTAQASLHQQGRERLRVLATLGDLDVPGGEVRLAPERPRLPAPAECQSLAEVAGMGGGPGEPPPLMGRFDLRVDPENAGWARGTSSGRGVIEGWVRLADGRPWDTLSLLLVVDMLLPTTFDLAMPGWAPTVELTAHVRARPAPGWLQVRLAARDLAGGLFVEDAEVWDDTGRLVADARQLAMPPRA